MPLLADIAVENTTYSYDKLYTYCVPSHLEGHIFVGSIVLAPFGFGKAKPRIGVVLGLQEAPAAPPRTKALLDAAPVDTTLGPELVKIVEYLHEATFCTFYEAVRAVLPYGAQFKAERQQGEWKLQQKMVRHEEPAYSLVGAAAVTPPAPAGAAPAEAGAQAKPPRRTAQQQRVLDYLAQSGTATEDDICNACSVSGAVLKTLMKGGFVTRSMQPRTMALFPDEAQPLPLPPLSPEQAEVAEQLRGRMGQTAPKPALLHGVTGSGKTRVFLELVQAALDAGKTALVLVPEIGLTPQMVRHLRTTFGDKVALQHSGLSHTERLLQWIEIQQGKKPVVVGTRSAVFAPLDTLGLIVVDEEQERTYQSESAPRYNALEVARLRAARHGALLVFASATPLVSDYFFAKNGRYELFRLRRRYGDLPLPAVELIDMKQDALAGNSGAVSLRLTEALQHTVAAGRQAILLLNRRGYNTVATCRECGEVVRCEHCSVPMVYHKAQNRLLCHYCGHAIVPPPAACPACGGELRYTGAGTQRLEEELAEKLPGARILRMDLDSTQRKGAHTAMLEAFGRGEYDLLLGTQMVAKGLDFERVSLVGVIGIDSMLYAGGYRAAENVFSLVTQVVGRAGRAGAPGKALIQTSEPQSSVLQLAARQDYEGFYREEIDMRKIALYPPFCTLCTVGFVGADEAAVGVAALRFRALLLQQADGVQPPLPLEVLGPAPMNVKQVAGAFRWRLTLKCRNNEAFRALARHTMEAYVAEGLPDKASLYFDFNADTGA